MMAVFALISMYLDVSATSSKENIKVCRGEKEAAKLYSLPCILLWRHSCCIHHNLPVLASRMKSGAKNTVICSNLHKARSAVHL